MLLKILAKFLYLAVWMESSTFVTFSDRELAKAGCDPLSTGDKAILVDLRMQHWLGSKVSQPEEDKGNSTGNGAEPVVSCHDITPTMFVGRDTLPMDKVHDTLAD